MDRTLDIDVKGRDHDGFFFHGQGLLAWGDDGTWHGVVATPVGMLTFTLTPQAPAEPAPEPAAGSDAPVPVVMPAIGSAAATPEQLAPAKPMPPAAKPAQAAAPAPEPAKDVSDAAPNT